MIRRSIIVNIQISLDIPEDFCFFPPLMEVFILVAVGSLNNDIEQLL